ncbi:MAG: Ldh family oxidoreductase, partial [Chloroflexi bacterium]|nr:Ldh family oxidoreductase [Chloroflexota bacterium]
IRIPQYVEDVKKGRRDPKAEPEVVADRGAFVRVDGHQSFGQVVCEFATRKAIEKARSHGVGLAVMGALGHAGRIGSYGEIVAREGLASIMLTGVLGGGSTIVAPFGGSFRRMSTNPVSIVFPYRPDCPLLLDFATSVGAEGKLRVYRNRGHMLPDEWVLDSKGKPSRDPNDFYGGGAILPLGGLHGGHKGYALAFMAAVLGGIVGEIGQPEPAPDAFTSGSTMIVMDTELFGPLEGLNAKVEAFVRYMKEAPLMPGHEEILFPGEKEFKSRQKRLKEGVDIEQTTWDQIARLIKEYRLPSSLGSPA